MKYSAVTVHYNVDDRIVQIDGYRLTNLSGDFTKDLLYQVNNSSATRTNSFQWKVVKSIPEILERFKV